MASVILPAGGSFTEWAPRPETAVQKSLKASKTDQDLQYDAIRNLPGIRKEAQALDLEEIEEFEPPCEDGESPCPPEFGGDEEGEKKKGEIDIDISEEGEESSGGVAEQAKDIAEEASELAEKAQALADEADGGKGGDEISDDLATVDVVIDGDLPDDLPDDDLPAGVLDDEDGEVEKEGMNGFAKAKGKKTTAGKKTASVQKTNAPKSKFTSLAALSPENRKEVREYWVALGFPTEYVDSMVQDYEE